MIHLGARELIDSVVDPGTYSTWDAPPRQPGGISAEYADELARARDATGADEALITGEGRINDRRVGIVASEFGFLAGSIGVAAADRLVACVERATRERLPLLAAPASGGTRMQEGTPAFVRMVAITQAVTAHKAAGLPYLVYLRHPTVGGVFASWGSLGHVTVAEPGALIGFLGPRVYRALHATDFPPGVQTAENLVSRGLLDAVVAPTEIRGVLDRALAVLLARGTDHPAGTEPPEEPVADVPAWESIRRSRDPRRPGVRRLLRYAATDVVPLNGTGAGEHDPGLIVALARFGGAPCVLLAHDRRGQDHPLGPGALREARRGMRLAADLDLPVVSVVDTPGAALSVEAEQGGLAGEIARCLADLVTLPSPTLTLLLGQGTGGAALALLPADRVIAAQHAWLSPLPPEGASAIVHGTVDFAPQVAEAQGVRALALRREGIVDRIIPEHPDAADEPEPFCHRVGAVLRGELARLTAEPRDQRLSRRSAWIVRVAGAA